MWLPKLYAVLMTLGTGVETLQKQMRNVMSAQETINAAMAELREEVAASVQQSKDQAAQLADLTTKLAAGIQGDPSVDIAGIAMQVHEQAMALKSSLAAAHTDAIASKTANADTSVVQGGAALGPDVVSASSPGTIVPEKADDEASQEVPKSLGGGAMPAQPATPGATEEKAPGSDLPPSTPEPESKPAEPSVPSVEDVPSDVSDNAPASTKKG